MASRGSGHSVFVQFWFKFTNKTLFKNQTMQPSWLVTAFTFFWSLNGRTILMGASITFIGYWLLRTHRALSIRLKTPEIPSWNECNRHFPEFDSEILGFALRGWPKIPENRNNRKILIRLEWHCHLHPIHRLFQSLRATPKQIIHKCKRVFRSTISHFGAKLGTWWPGTG